VNRWLLLAGALGVLAAGALLLWQLHGGSAGDPAPAPAPATERAHAPTAPARPPLPGVAPRPRAPVRPAPETAADDPAAVEGGDPESLTFEHAARKQEDLARAEHLLRKGDAAGARDAARKALDAHPGEPRMLRVLVVASCALKDADQARRYYRELDAGERLAVGDRCRGTGIDLDR
jgi:hypothetical protein